MSWMVEAHVRANKLRRNFALLALPALCGVLACGGATAPAPYTLSANLRGVREVPPNGALAQGTASFTLVGDRLTYVVTANGLSSPIVVGHLHIGASGTIGPVIIPFAIASQAGIVAQGEVDLSKTLTYNTLTLAGDSLRTLMIGGYTYVNLFTTGYPGGEIRGQVARQ